MQRFVHQKKKLIKKLTFLALITLTAFQDFICGNEVCCVASLIEILLSLNLLEQNLNTKYAMRTCMICFPKEVNPLFKLDLNTLLTHNSLLILVRCCFFMPLTLNIVDGYRDNLSFSLWPRLS